jgi:hypothetical protein
MEINNGIIINGHIYGLVDDADVTRCDRCALMEKCVDFWGMAEEGNPKLCTFLYGDEANNKRFDNPIINNSINN